MHLTCRDLKPENVVFVADELDSPLKIIDFGRSKILQPKERITERAGSVRTLQTP